MARVVVAGDRISRVCGFGPLLHLLLRSRYNLRSLGYSFVLCPAQTINIAPQRFGFGAPSQPVSFLRMQGITSQKVRPAAVVEPLNFGGIPSEWKSASQLKLTLGMKSGT